MRFEYWGSGEKTGNHQAYAGFATGGLEKLNTYDWLAARGISDDNEYRLVEVSFKNGNQKIFYEKPEHLDIRAGDMVTVDAGNGYNVGRVTLCGELARLQMRKKKVSPNHKFLSIIRPASDRDLENLKRARGLERNTMVRARVIARSLGLEMKISDVEYQADMKKAIFYFIANGRVDFRQLIKDYAREFRVKIEMRQIGARQEAALIGGVGSSGRELCCSSWLTDFSSVTTAAARYQNLALNQSKLTGQCGRLKCCLNYELDMYIEALNKYPKRAKRLKTKSGTAELMKIDIFKQVMHYSYKDESGRYQMIALDPVRAQEIYEANQRNEFPEEFEEQRHKESGEETVEYQFEKDLTGIIELPEEKKSGKKGGHKKRRGKRGSFRKKKPSGKNNNSGKK